MLADTQHNVNMPIIRAKNPPPIILLSLTIKPCTSIESGIIMRVNGKNVLQQQMFPIALKRKQAIAITTNSKPVINHSFDITLSE